MDFEEFAAARTPLLVRLAIALSGDTALAEDLVQDVLIKLHKGWERIRLLDSPEAYVRQMLVNEFLSWRRKWARVIPFNSIELPARELTDEANAHADRALLRAEISRLPKAKQVVLALRYYGGLTDSEIADAMGCSVGTVRSHASRALATLRIQPALRDEYAATRPTQGRAL